MLLPFAKGYMPDDIIIHSSTGDILYRQFLADVEYYIQQLPESKSVINLCENRYNFLVGFAAAVMKKQMTLLPMNKSKGYLQKLKDDNGAYFLTDEKNKTLTGSHVITHQQDLIEGSEMELVDAERVIISVFTSGSTGEPKIIKKTWGELVTHTQKMFQALSLKETERYAFIGTVPSQHMYGFEHIVVMALQHGCIIENSTPYFPKDICESVSALPKPRVLITTPLHLHACIESGVTFENLELIISATAPLKKELAVSVEDRNKTRVVDIYGSTETGAIATRQTSCTEEWTLLPGLTLSQRTGLFYVENETHGTCVQLSDDLELKSDTTFLFIGRAEDNIKIAGKRMSLQALNNLIKAIPGVDDCATALLSINQHSIERIVAFIVCERLSQDDIYTNLIDKVDPVFLPKKILFLKELPRNELGKLPKDKLIQLLQDNENDDNDFTIKSEHPCLAGHFPGNPIVPGVVILEKIVSSLKKKSFENLTFKTVRFSQPLLPEQKCTINITHNNGEYKFTCMTSESTVATGKFIVK